jgi:hypothetical protein
LDKDWIIEITLIECLRHFVEEEDGLVKLTTLQEQYNDLFSAYEYIVTKYDKRAEVIINMSTTSTVKEISAMLDTQEKEKEDAVKKIWKHYRHMWT